VILGCESKRNSSDAKHAVADHDEGDAGDEAAGADDLAQDGEPRLVVNVAPEIVAVDEVGGGHPGDAERDGIRAAQNGRPAQLDLACDDRVQPPADEQQRQRQSEPRMV